VPPHRALEEHRGGCRLTLAKQRPEQRVFEAEVVVEQGEAEGDVLGDDVDSAAIACVDGADQARGEADLSAVCGVRDSHHPRVDRCGRGGAGCLGGGVGHGGNGRADRARPDPYGLPGQRRM
jgi:hypothetical protein